MVPLLVGLLTIPYVIRSLGDEGFGVLAIAWALLGYFSLFDLGLSRATTKFVAECLGRGELGEIPGFFWVSVSLQLLLGIGGGVVFAILTPALTGRLLKIPPDLQRGAEISFLILAGSLPMVLVTNTLRGMLEAAQRFDLVNYARVPANAAIFLLPIVGLLVGFHLPGIVLLLVLARAGAGVAYWRMCVNVFPAVGDRIRFDAQALRSLIPYGWWITVSNLVNPFLAYMDRFFIAGILSIGAVTYYAAPYEIASRLLILPTSLAMTLFAGFSTVAVSTKLQGHLTEIYARSLNGSILVMGPLLALAVAFSPEALRLWLGPAFAQHSTIVLQILILGVFVNSLSFIPFNLLQGVGRPDLTAKFHLFELPIHLTLLWFLVTQVGIVGAALAWTLRISLDAVLLFIWTARLGLWSPRDLGGSGIFRSSVGVSAFSGVLLIICLLVSSPLTKVLLVALAIPIFGSLGWFLLLGDPERDAVHYLVRKAAGTPKRARQTT